MTWTNIQRKEVRLKWWKFDQLPLSLHDLALVPPETLKEIPDELIYKSDLPPDTDARPVSLWPLLDDAEAR